MDSKVAEKPSVSLLINEKPKRRRLRVGDPDFVPPDGGWGWLVVFACGFSNMSMFPMMQQFGLVFREKFQLVGLSETQTTTITNLASAFNAAVGLTNGPIYRRFTYRQVAVFFSSLVGLSLFSCAFCDSFWTYILCFSILYGSSFGFVQSANAIALNTYFKEKRRVATGFSWTTTAMGPVVWPYIIVFLSDLYGMEGVVMLFAAFSLHALVGSLLLQPVEWHTKFRDEIADLPKMPSESENLQGLGGRLSRISSKIFSSQYFSTEDNPNQPGYEIIDPGTSMMLRCNDGWYSQSKSQVGSRISLYSNRGSRRPSFNNAVDYGKERDTRKAMKERKISQAGIPIKEEAEHEEKQPMIEQSITLNELYPDEKITLNGAAKKLYEYEQQHKEPEQEVAEKKLSLWRKISIFFDFELFKDWIYVNLMVGITVANFAELNFSILTPIIMAEFNFPKYEIATFMSLLAIIDIVFRFCIPFVADKVGWSNRNFFLIGVMSMALGRIIGIMSMALGRISKYPFGWSNKNFFLIGIISMALGRFSKYPFGWSNRNFFLVGIMSMALGRIILIHTQTYPVALFVAVIIGAGKALRTVFVALVIPSHVPLDRLPAASGLQLAFSGILFVILGPIVGGVRQLVGNYETTLHLLNICTYFTVITWTIESIITEKKKKQKPRISRS